MENKLNNEKIAHYSRQVATKLLNSFFADREKISGEDILNFCAIKQVNLFALKVLFQKWNEESEKLESPYFDYDNPEVIAALDHFKNTVSRHLSVSQSSFEPILIKAIAETLMLICSPYDYYLNELNAMHSEGAVTKKGLIDIKKFTKVNRAILEGLIDGLDQTTPEPIALDAKKMLDSVIRQLSSAPDDIDTYIEAFSNYVPLNLSDIYLQIEKPSAVEQPEKPTIQTQEIAQEEETIPHVSEEPTLNEALAPENQMSLADMHEQQKIENLSKGITLNQRFMFVNILFGGDVAKFNNTILEIDGLVTLDEVKHYLNTHMGHWDKTSYEVEEFMKILERRFS